MNFSKIQYPVCPHCKYELNNLEIFSLWDLHSPDGIFKTKTCLNTKCQKQFGMAVRIELTTETIALE